MIHPKFIFTVLVSAIFFNTGCKKDENYFPPSVKTLPATYITESSFISGGTVTSTGGTDLLTRGICWSTHNTPTTSDSVLTDSSTGNSFISIVTNLTPGTLYHLRAFATNSEGTSYGEEISFTTNTLDIRTSLITNITTNSALSGGTIESDGMSLAVKTKGVCWSNFPSPTTMNNKTEDGSGSSKYVSNINGLSLFTTYYVRAYITNNNGTIYGNEVMFTTLNGVVTLSTQPATDITATTASVGSTISNDGGSPVTARGICWSKTSTPTISDNKTASGSGTGSYSSNITGLTPASTYYVRAYATNSAGTWYGSPESFTTMSGIIQLSTNEAININSSSATSGGYISSTGGSAIINSGICWSAIPNPTIDDQKTTNGGASGSFSSQLSGLTLGKNYYVRAYATNAIGTFYGNQISFKTVLNTGDSYQGGYIGYILQQGDPGYVSGETHGLIVAPEDQSAGIAWWNGTSVATGATSAEIGSGNANTLKIINVQGSGNYAAQLCHDLVLGGYSDWYLPSREELARIHKNSAYLSGFSAYFYWNSTEENEIYSWSENFGVGISYYINKNNLYKVRAVRSF